ncbi:MAG: glycosyltransferase family 4 protein [Saprospiraceae bacterium]|nr:glycosyltransferase family 4 protein [Saprospiraceae bacterium]
MRVGFYYHIAIARIDEKLYLPGYLAVFINALAAEVRHLTLFLHEAHPAGMVHCDTELTASNITWINLGPKLPAWRRSIFYQKALRPMKAHLGALDCMLVRGPSPLAPYIKSVVPAGTTTAYFVVGDYRESIKGHTINNLRDIFIRHYVKWNDRAFSRTLSNQLVIVNSGVLYERYKGLTDTIDQVRTTTLSPGDFWTREDTCRDDVVRLAYIGRFDLQKGLIELLQAGAQLAQEGMVVEIHFTGWEDAPHRPVENKLKAQAAEWGLQERVFFHGKKSVGEALNAMYRQADIYVIPSYQEGFPRTIWEAMANSCPVIATRVGSIPHYLEHEHHALLIEPKDVGGIAEAVKRILKDDALRQKLIRNGYALAQTNTLEIQTKRLVEILAQHLP